MREVLGPLLALTIGLALVYVVLTVYQRAIEAGGSFSLAQAGVILLALLWEIMMSGASITNQGGRWFPRHARVLMFFGYILLVATAVLFFSTQHEVIHGTHAEPDFESEAWPPFGVLSLGIPLLIAVVVVTAIPRRKGASPPGRLRGFWGVPGVSWFAPPGGYFWFFVPPPPPPDAAGRGAEGPGPGRPSH